jgi:uncharacterized protein YjiS (DUF1127 family)
MFTYDTPYRSAAALLWAANVLRALARRMHLGARHLDAWLEQRRAAIDARRHLGMMNDRELWDIGLTRADVERVAHGGPGAIFNSIGACIDA